MLFDVGVEGQRICSPRSIPQGIRYTGHVPPYAVTRLPDASVRNQWESVMADATLVIVQTATSSQVNTLLLWFCPLCKAGHRLSWSTTMAFSPTMDGGQVLVV